MESYMNKAIELAYRNTLHQGGKPFGAVIVKNGEIIATGVNEVLSTNDPTAHAEMQAIRQASRVLNSPQLTDCEIYASGQPCPMCLAAIYWSGAKAVYYAYTEEDAAAIGLSTRHVYQQLSLPMEQQTLPITRIAPMTERNPMQLYKQRNNL
ncbi:nucleoside deaminase [Paenibacillus sp. OAS669]|uniref:nucleoside deaminase n=1 Tax=Paenibacillus sp. OAS669 TaxID=2663821 RepID=UPI00178AB403|nr:nucleoside deaminase [Paenibacillus sp. OAS669]MBE1442001.1 guanine deaminase [Paenibacillus sp. OAS669]